MGLCSLLRGWLYLLYVYNVRTSQETHLWASAASYGYGCNFYMYMVFVPHRRHTYGLLQPLMGMALPFICIRCFYLSGDTSMGLCSLLRVKGNPELTSEESRRRTRA
jgi:hypothetical protein